MFKKIYNKKIFTLVIVGFQLLTLKAQDIANASFGKGIEFVAKDSSMSMKMRFRIQSLFEGNNNLSDGTWSSNFLVRRARLKFGGFAYSPKLTYFFEMGLSNNDINTLNEDNKSGGSARLILDAVVKYQFSKHWNVWIGQAKLPGNRERLVSSSSLQFVDRSLVNSRFNIDRDIGMQLHGNYKLGKNFYFKPVFALTKGEGRGIISTNLGGLNYTGRVVFLPLGKFVGKKEGNTLSDIQRQPKPKVSIGLTGNYNDRAVRQQGQLGKFVYDTLGNLVENTLLYLDADFLFKYKGFSTLIEIARTSSEKNREDLENNYNVGYGINTQAGYLFRNNYEIAGRYTMLSPFENSGITQTKEYTLAFSKYIVGHSLKVQTDFSFSTQKHNTTSSENIRMRLQVEMQF